jgi:hypothetical protein
MDKQTLFLGRTDQGIFAQGLFCSMEKVAGAPGPMWETAPRIRQFIKTLKAEDRKKNCYVLVNALGAGEFFGSNINADYFPWNALAHEGEDYGHRTFLNAHAFAHHVNKDPEKAFGIPEVSVLNPRMKRVELVIKLDREKAKRQAADGIITRIDNGEFPDVSMGCKVPYDVCSICGNQSKTRDDYCEHMRPGDEMRGIWGPNKILPDGRKIYVINTLPRFFDISFVFMGADKTAKVMAKLASKGAHVCLGPVCALPSSSRDEGPSLYGPTGAALDVAALRKTASASCDERRGPCGRKCGECAERDRCETEKLASAFGVKQAAHPKMSELVKSIPSAAFSARKLPELERREKDLPPEVLDALAEYPLPNSTGATTAAGMVLKPREFQRLVLMRAGQRRLADSLDQRGLTFRAVHRFDDSVDPQLPADPELIRRLMPYLMARSAYAPVLQVRVMGVSIAPDRGNKALPTGGAIEHPSLDKISAAYNGYRRNVLMKLGQAGEVVLGDSKLRSAVLGSELVNMFSKTASQTKIIDHDTVAYMMSAHLSNRSLLSPTADVLAAANPWLLSELSA